MKKRYSASEIAKMGLDGLPTSKAAIIARASSEGWPFEEEKGVGGTRRAYEIPAHYLSSTQKGPKQGRTPSMEERFAEVKERQKAEGMDDVELLEAIIDGVERFGQTAGAALTPQRKATLITLFYKYFRDEGTVDQQKLGDMLRKVG